MTSSTNTTAGWRSRRLGRYLEAYAEHHQNSTNRFIHWVGVPLICWSILAAFASLPFPQAFSLFPGFGWATLLGVVMSVYYFTLSVPLGVGMAINVVLYLAIVRAVEIFVETPLWVVALVVFIFGWVLQFIGHKIEGRKPKFFDDVRFLLIGPVWVLAGWYRLLGIKY